MLGTFEQGIDDDDAFACSKVIANICASCSHSSSVSVDDESFQYSGCAIVDIMKSKNIQYSAHFERIDEMIIMYLTFTRLDIAYAVQQICLFMHAPREPHFSALKRIIRYTKGTFDYRLYIILVLPIASLRIQTQTGRDAPTHVDLHPSDNLISWSAKRQPAISRSSVEAEYRGVANVVVETCWLRNLLLELGVLHEKLPLYTVTMSPLCTYLAIRFNTNAPNTSSLTYILRWRWVKFVYFIFLLLINIFTKGLPRQLFLDFRSSLSVHPGHARTAGENAKNLNCLGAFGWSDSDINTIAKRQSVLFSSSEERLRKGLDFFMVELGYEPSWLAARGSLLMYSLERRVKPRYQV
ncbi:LOW QUALITY PROTEIN: hypothetical protein OSB04_005700 [Centaurea solstitialis]|uniref:Uncharacterized protein n=1 Tax=Centaurea solstitialis TaxID=347529 RepID=A0AA38WPV9_9ASTR|nr:LOW QUALITY PROTEIN: hypothetical protein OSB04_005700 [Centaurea solstitialis]